MVLTTEVGWILMIVLFSTFVRSAFGFGDALIAMPLLTLVVGLKTATPVVALIASTISLTILVRHWRDVQVGSAWRLIVSTLIGIPVGLWLLKGAYEETLKLILAGVIIGFSSYQLIKPHILRLRTEKPAYLFGLIAGILGGAYNTNGPAVVIYGSLREWPSESFRATLQGYFFPTGLMITLGHGFAGLWTRTVWSYYLLALPVVLTSIWIGGHVHRKIPKGKFDRIIHILLILIGAFLVFETIRDMALTGS